jgi:putative addiction module component (TIGR02574 family)
MNANIYNEIVKLDVATRLQLAQDLLDSVASESFSLPVTDEQRVELQTRLAHHRANPEETTVSLADIKSKAGIS